MKEVYRATRSDPIRKDLGLCDHLRRAAVSITSNVAEGHERGATPDLIQFLYFAKGSAGEVRSQLYHAEDLGYLTGAQAGLLRENARNISRQLQAWIISMQTAGFSKGPKYHKEPGRPVTRTSAKIGFERTPDGTLGRGHS